MDLIERLGKERYEQLREKFAGWEMKEVIIDDDRAFWEIKKPGSIYEKVSLYRDAETMMIYGDYGRYTFNNMTWYGTPQNLRYDCLGYQMEKLDFNTKEALRVFDIGLCEEEIREWLAKKLTKEWGISPEDSKELADLDPDEWIMAEEHVWDHFDEEQLRDNFKCFCEDKNASIEDILEAVEAAGDFIDVDYEFDYRTVSVREDNICEKMAFAKEAIEAARKGEIPFLSSLECTEYWEFADELRKNNTGYRTNECFYVALVALEVLGDKLKEREAELEEERE